MTAQIPDFEVPPNTILLSDVLYVLDSLLRTAKKIHWQGRHINRNIELRNI